MSKSKEREGKILITDLETDEAQRVMLVSF